MGPSPVWIPEAGTRIEAAGGECCVPVRPTAPPHRNWVFLMGTPPCAGYFVSL